MRVLIVCSGNFKHSQNHPYTNAAFIDEQIDALRHLNCEVHVFYIHGKGIIGYLKNLMPLMKIIKVYNIDILHAHYGLSATLASFISNKPLITTFHGSDINFFLNRIISLIPVFRSNWLIFVSKKLKEKTFMLSKKNYSVIPCGVNLQTFIPIEKQMARKQLSLPLQKRIILFSSSFDNPVKNFSLAKKSIEKLNIDVEIIEIKNKTRKEVCLLLNSADLLLLTSISEGSPQIIKEAMACNCPIVATNVGDIAELMKNTLGCFVTSFDPLDITSKINLALEFGKRSNGREFIKQYDGGLIASKVYKIYTNILNQ